MNEDDCDLVPGLSVSRETLSELRDFLKLVEKWNSAINLIAKSTVLEAWDRHVRDSAQIFPLTDDATKTWADLGSGAGFPGIVIAIMSKKLRPACKFTLIESDLRKATFLREAVRVHGLNAEVVNLRIESIEPLQSDIISARALAPLPELLGLTFRHLAHDGTALFLKGRTHLTEVSEARNSYEFSVESIKSSVAEDSAILRIRGITNVA
jgi:16S rRNA (guanine527-N7)-methyltransferase